MTRAVITTRAATPADAEAAVEVLRRSIVELCGGIASARLWHRIAGLAFSALAVFHFVRVIRSTLSRRVRPSMMSRLWPIWTKEVGVIIYSSRVGPPTRMTPAAIPYTDRNAVALTGSASGSKATTTIWAWGGIVVPVVK